MTQQEMQHRKLFRYMVGFGKGGSGLPWDDEVERDPDFKQGFEDGKKAYRQAYKQACQHYQSELNLIKTGEIPPKPK